MLAHSHLRLAVFGFGNMGRAIVDGALRTSVLRADEIAVIELDEEKRADAARRGCLGSLDPAVARAVPDVVLAVKPQAFSALAPALRDRAARTVFLSVMAGVSGATIRATIGPASDSPHGVIRAMPNTPCTIGLGMTAIALSSGARPGDDALAQRLFASVGRVISVDESMLDAVTATSGSGPAYLFLLAESWETAAIELGFEAAVARDLVRQTIVGAARMLEDRAISAAELRAAVTSEGGTTAAAIDVLERRGLPAALRDAIRAAEARSRELGSR